MAIKTFDERISDMKAAREVRGDVPGLFHANINVLNRETSRTPWRTRRSTRA